MSLLQAIIVAIVEGLTEFLPVSSTGHMILTSYCLGMENTEFLKTYEIFIQLGAILAIVTIYTRRFLTQLELYKKLIVAFIPTAIIGYLAYPLIKTYLFSPLVVSISLILGGIVLIWIDRTVREKKARYEDLQQISYREALGIGTIQGLSVIPGVSRAAATIIGGVFNGLDKKQATEFSFLLAVPTMMAATGYDLLKTPFVFSNEEIRLLTVGFITAFAFAWIAVKLFLSFVDKYGFVFFGWYRIVIGLLFLLLFYRDIF
ncbi:MAG TPA: undecaprenyl-diphosphate phosphatase [Saprospiraceae bacterium]|nr:undecaprenyl-diphosphate phosphatase [Saprospiraceae bacterium]